MNKPSKYPLQFLHWFCQSDLIEDIEGDLIEIYETKQREKGKRKADWLLWMEVIKLFRPEIIRINPLGGIGRTDMLFHQFKSSFRYLTKHSSFTILNVLSLAIGMAAAMLIFQYVYTETNYDAFHEKGAHIYRVTTEWNAGQTANDQRATSVYWSGPGVKEAFPEVENYTQITPLSVFTGKTWIQHKHNSLADLNIYISDTSFFDVFTFEIQGGSTQSMLTQPFSIVLTASVSSRLFKENNPIGQTVSLKSGNGNFKESPYGDAIFKVTGIVKDPPPNSHLQFEALVSKNSLWDFNSGSMYWHWDYLYTYLLLRPDADAAAMGKKISDLRNELFSHEFGSWNDQIDFRLQALSAIHLNNSLTAELTASSDEKSLFLLVLVMLCMLASAYINYLNLATVKAMERKKETGIRKIMGSSKTQLISQLLVESIILNMLALGIAIMMMWITKPLLELMFEFSWPVSSFESISGSIIIYAGILIGLGILLSVFYPAFIVISFKPKDVLKGIGTSARKGGSQWMFRKSLIVFQFGFCIAFVIIAFVLQRQLSYMKNHELGFNARQVVVIPVHGFQDMKAYQLFKTKALSSPKISAVAFSSASPGSEINLLGLKYRLFEDERLVGELKIVSIDQDFFETLQIDLLAGRIFDAARKTDAQTVILNEEAARLMGWGRAEEVLGETLELNVGAGKKTVIGIVKNYHQLSLKRSFEPLIFVPAWEWNRSWMERNVLIKLAEVNGIEDMQSSLAEIENAWHQAVPELPFNYFFLDDYFEQQYQEELSFSALFIFFSGCSIFISCLGLFGLVAYTTLQRTKEIGIRKILGATLTHILVLISREFITLIGIASCLVLPLVYLALRNWLDQYAFRVALSSWFFLIPCIAIIGMSLCIVMIKSLNIALANPVDNLKHE